ncbi:MAG: V-type ATP synthase subunit E [Candidatus Brocadia sp.]
MPHHEGAMQSRPYNAYSLSMSIERIRNYILENAQKEAEQIIKTAEEQFRTQVEETKLTMEKQYLEMLHTEEERLKENMKRTLTTLKREYKMKLLEAKNSAIDNVLARAIERIQLLPDEDYLALIGKWLAKIPDHLEGELFVNARDLKRITDAFVDNINKKRKARIKLHTLTTIDIKGGFILKTEHFEIDYTLDAIARNIRTTLTPKLKEMLGLDRYVN